jgi:uncharacterized SAM-binding protein YcdF (DUF218 family)
VLRLLGRGVGLLLAAVVVLVAVTAGRVVWAAEQDDRTPADALVVLGAAQYDGTPAAYLAARLEHALELHEDGVAPVVVTVGGQQPGDRFTEAAAGRAWLVDRGVAEDAVVEVPRGGNTLASMSAVADVMRERGLGSAVVVTDPWHSLRATRMLEQQGVDAHASPTRTGPANQGAEVAVRYTVRETAAYLYWLWQRLTT